MCYFSVTFTSMTEEKTKVRSIRFPTDLMKDVNRFLKEKKKSFNKYVQELVIEDISNDLVKKIKKRN